MSLVALCAHNLRVTEIAVNAKSVAGKLLLVAQQSFAAQPAFISVKIELAESV